MCYANDIPENFCNDNLSLFYLKHSLVVLNDRPNNLITIDTEVENIGSPILDYQLAGLSQPTAEVKVSSACYNAFDRLQNYIGLDTMSEISIFKPSLMLDKKPCSTILVTGVNGGTKPVTVNQKGCSVLGLNAYCSNDTVGNILSFADARDSSYSLQWNNELDQFELQVFENGETYIFKRHPGSETLYMCNLNEAVVYVQTVTDNSKFYTKRQRVMANKARLLQRRLGFVSTQNLIKMINSGLILNCEVTQGDVQRAELIYGQDIGEIKGKSTAEKGPIIVIDDNIKAAIIEPQVAHCDIFFVDKKPFLLTLFTETEYSMCTRIKSRNSTDVIPALLRHILEMRRVGFEVKVIRCDGEGAIVFDAEDDAQLLKHGLIVDPVTAGEAVPRIERKIRTIKEKARCLCTTLPFRLARKVEDSAIIWATNRVNIMPTVNSSEYITPREKVYGRKIDARIDGKHGFGDYVQIINAKTDNSMTERSRGAIALLPTGNLDGSWYYYTLDNANTVRRRRSRALPMPEEVILRLNQLYTIDHNSTSSVRRRAKDNPKNNWDLQNFQNDDDEEVNTDKVIQQPQVSHDVGYTWEFVLEPEVDSQGESIRSTVPAADQLNTEEIDQTDADSQLDNLSTNDITQPTIMGNDQVIDYERSNSVHLNQGEVSSGNTTIIEEPTAMEEPIYLHDTGLNQPGSDGTTSTPKHQHNLRVEARKPSGFWRACELHVSHISKPKKKNMTVKKALERLGDDAENSIRSEMELVISQKEAFKPVHVNELDYNQRKTIIPSMMFLKEKFNAEGQFEKLKSRLVAGGHRQDKEVFESVSSSTVSTSSVLMIAAIAAVEQRAIAVIDFPGAYLNSPLPSDHPTVYMRLDKELTRIACEIDPTYNEYLKEDGTVVVKLLKALYGCVQSSKVWYDMLTTKLGGIGYVKNPQDTCVFNKYNAKSGKQVTVVIHVDDIMMTTSGEDNISHEIKLIQDCFGELTVSRGKNLNYLGMNFVFLDKSVKITMGGFISDFLQDMDSIIPGTCETPASKELFQIGDTKLVDDNTREFFHSTVARLLYLAKRVRPDILLTISYLAKRVQHPNEDDYKKLCRLVKYIRRSSELGIILEADKLLHVVAWIDASHAVHVDHKSHSATVISLGKGPIYQKSGSQRINTKSSTESETVALSDGSSQVIWSRNFLIDQGYKLDPALIYQDNTSTMFLIKNGKSNSERTKHIATRFYFVKDRVESGEIKIEYLQTAQMVADILTKPLQGALFFKLRALLHNWPLN